MQKYPFHQGQQSHSPRQREKEMLKMLIKNIAA